MIPQEHTSASNGLPHGRLCMSYYQWHQDLCFVGREFPDLTNVVLAK